MDSWPNSWIVNIINSWEMFEMLNNEQLGAYFVSFFEVAVYPKVKKNTKLQHTSQYR